MDRGGRKSETEIVAITDKPGSQASVNLLDFEDDEQEERQASHSEESKSVEKSREAALEEMRQKAAAARAKQLEEKSRQDNERMSREALDALLA